MRRVLAFAIITTIFFSALGLRAQSYQLLGTDAQGDEKNQVDDVKSLSYAISGDSLWFKI